MRPKVSVSPRFLLNKKTMGKSVCFRNDYNKSLTSKVEQNLHYQMMAQQNKKLQRNLVTEESNMKRNSKSMATLSHYDLIYHCSLPNMQQCTYLQQATEVSTKIWKTTVQNTVRWNLAKHIQMPDWCDLVSIKSCFQKFPQVWLTKFFLQLRKTLIFLWKLFSHFR